jgi:curved DNA-binding protein CbpA
VAASVNHYAILGVPENASLDEIRRPYRLRIKAAHPDRARNEPDRERLTEEASIINAAKTALLDPARRAAHDLDLANSRRFIAHPSTTAGPSAPSDSAPSPSSPWHDPARGTWADLKLRQRMIAGRSRERPNCVRAGAPARSATLSG